MAYPQFPQSVEVTTDGKRYVIEVVRGSAGRMYVEVHAIGKAPTWRAVTQGGPRYQRVLLTQGLAERIAACSRCPRDNE